LRLWIAAPKGHEHAPAAVAGGRPRWPRSGRNYVVKTLASGSRVGVPAPRLRPVRVASVVNMEDDDLVAVVDDAVSHAVLTPPGAPQAIERRT
jgi:hypothetical protein